MTQRKETEVFIDLGVLGDVSAQVSYDYTAARLSGSYDLPDDPHEIQLRSLRCALLSEEGLDSLMERLEEDTDFAQDLFSQVEESELGLED